VVWRVIAVVGAGLDMAAAVKAVKALGPAAKALNASGDVAEFTKPHVITCGLRCQEICGPAATRRFWRTRPTMTPLFLER